MLKYVGLPLGDTFAKAVAFTMYVIAARSLTDADVGFISLFLVISGYALSTSALGLDVYGTTRVMREGSGNAREVFYEISRARIALTCIVLVVSVPALLGFVGHGHLAWPIQVAALAALLAASATNASWVGVGLGETWRIGVARSTSRLGSLAVFALLAFTSGVSTLAFVICFCIGPILESILLLGHLSVRLPTLRSCMEGFATFLGYARSRSSFIFLTLWMTLYVGADQVLLYHFLDAKAVAPYAEAFRLYWVAGGVAILLSDAAWHRLDELLPRLRRRSLIWLGVLFGSMFVSSACGYLLVPILYGHEVGSQSSLTGLILFAGLPVLGARMLLLKVSITRGGERFAARACLVTLVGNISLNLALIGSFGSLGSAFAMFVTEMGTTGYLWWFVASEDQLDGRVK